VQGRRPVAASSWQLARIMIQRASRNRTSAVTGRPRRADRPSPCRSSWRRCALLPAVHDAEAPTFWYVGTKVARSMSHVLVRQGVSHGSASALFQVNCASSRFPDKCSTNRSFFLDRLSSRLRGLLRKRTACRKCPQPRRRGLRRAAGAPALRPARCRLRDGGGLGSAGTAATGPAPRRDAARWGISIGMLAFTSFVGTAAGQTITWSRPPAAAPGTGT